MKFNLKNFPESPQGISCQCEVCKWVKDFEAELREMLQKDIARDRWSTSEDLIKEILGE